MELQFGAIRRDELKEAAQLSARAYDDYVYVTNYFPDDEERRRGSPLLMHCVKKVNYGKTHILTVKADGRLAGVAQLDDPSYRKPSAFQYIRHGFLRLYLMFGLRRVNAFLAMDEAAALPCHDYQKTGPGIWYLCMLEVEPALQGKGIGTRFIAWMEDYIRERGGRELVLLTNSEKNLAFYRNRGFQVFHECEIVHEGRRMGSWSLKKAL